MIVIIDKMFGWYSATVAKEQGIVYVYKDKYNNVSLCSCITTLNKCPYLEESHFGSDVISIGEVKEYNKTIYLNENRE